MGLVTVRRFRDPHAAHLARARLESEGIQSFILNEHYVGMDWLHSQAVGGVELQVREEDASAALEVLDEPPPEFDGEFEAIAGVVEESLSDEHCPSCASLRIERDRTDHRLRAASLALGFPLTSGAYAWRCLDCDHRFRVVPPRRGFVWRVLDLLALVVGLVVAIVAIPIRFLRRILGRG